MCSLGVNSTRCRFDSCSIYDSVILMPEFDCLCRLTMYTEFKGFVPQHATLHGTRSISANCNIIVNSIIILIVTIISIHVNFIFSLQQFYPCSNHPHYSHYPKLHFFITVHGFHFTSHAFPY